MVKKAKAKRSSASGSKKSRRSVFGFDPDQAWPLARGTSGGDASSKIQGRLYIVGLSHKAQDLDAFKSLAPWIKERAEKRRGEPLMAQTADGPVWILSPVKKPSLGHHGGLLDLSPYGVMRDMVGSFVGTLFDYGLGGLTLEFVGATDEEQLGALVGLGVGAYRYRSVRASKSPASKLPATQVEGVRPEILERARVLSGAVNIARHLVNTPAGELNPKTFCHELKQFFKDSAAVHLEVITGEKLLNEKMGMLEAVGRGAIEGPALLHVRYQPKKKADAKSIAIVGKGVTFDTGGLNMKDGASMRLMKKDMGGAASLAGLLFFADEVQLATPVDFYFALAENSVDERSFRPGDILNSRAGWTVEIDNTDAEGRLVLGDALDYALTAEPKRQPREVIDLATLTGAMRVGLGTRFAGMFATDDKLADRLVKASVESADPVWRMPLVAEYFASMKSTVADFANSGGSRFGGAITAALFLQKFVGTVPWAHFDMYAWTDGGVGGMTEAGGNGQCVQLLANYLMNCN